MSDEKVYCAGASGLESENTKRRKLIEIEKGLKLREKGGKKRE